MITYDDNTRAADTARNCVLLMERIAEKYGCSDAPRSKQPKGARAEPATPALLAAVRAQGFMVLDARPAEQKQAKKCA